MTAGLYKKGIVLIVICLFLLTGLSSVYAGSIFNDMEILEDYGVETVETALDKIRTITDRELQKCPYNQSKMSTVKKIASRGPLLNSYDLSENQLKKLYNKIRQAALIDGEEYDIVVPDDCDTIQEAINNSVEGNRIFVRKGTYHENLIIDQDSITLVGEDKNSTIIIGNQSDPTIIINEVASNFYICCFTIKNNYSCNPGVFVLSDHNVMESNIFVHNSYGILSFESNGNKIRSNLFKDNVVGIKIDQYSNTCNISDNEILNNSLYGIVLENSSTYNSITSNIIQYNNESGIYLDSVSRGNIVSHNEICFNGYGVFCGMASDGNLYHHNNFISNKINAFDISVNLWDNGISGNYWDDYTGVDGDGDGIGDTPYNIAGGDNNDNYPLILEVLPVDNCFKDENAEYQVSSELLELLGNDSFSYEGDTIIVPDDYPSIQDAVNHSNDGDTILVKNGVYNEQVNVDKSIRLVGENPDHTTIDGLKESYNMSEFDTALDQYQIERSGHGWGCWNEGKFAQSFVPRLNNIAKISISVFKRGNPDGLRISIREKLNGLDLTYIDLDGDDISKKRSWIECDLPDLDLKTGKTYYIVWDPVGATEDNTFYWSDTSNDRYSNGICWFYDNISWDEHEAPELDFCFKTYGNYFSELNHNVITLLDDYVEVCGFTFKNCNSGFSGIRSYGDHCYIHNNTIVGCGGGIELWSTYCNRVENNTVNYAIWGVYSHRSVDCEIFENKMLSNIYGVQLGLSKIDVIDNYIYRNVLIGILSIWSDNFYLKDNNFAKNNIGLEMFSSNNNNITGNSINSNKFDGVSVYNSKNNSFNNNKVGYNSNGFSFWFYSKCNYVTFNNFSYNSDSAIYCSSLSSNISIEYNRINERSSSLHESDKGIVSYCTDINISNNYISFCDTCIYITAGKCIIYNNTIVGSGDLNECGILCGGSADSIIMFNDISNFGTVDNVHPIAPSLGIDLASGESNTRIIHDNFIHENSIGIGSGSITHMTLFLSIFGLPIALFLLPLALLSQNPVFLDAALIFLFGTFIAPFTFLLLAIYGLCFNTMIKDNLISDNNIGIAANGFRNCTIENNTISKNVKALYFDSLSINNSILNNDFLLNVKHVKLKNSVLNTFDGNYWGRPRFLPKPIFGRIGPVPWISYDLHPRLLPYYGEE